MTASVPFGATDVFSGVSPIANSRKGAAPQPATLSINAENWYFVK